MVASAPAAGTQRGVWNSFALNPLEDGVRLEKESIKSRDYCWLASVSPSDIILTVAPIGDL